MPQASALSPIDMPRLLHAVSRSFYLSIRLLPPSLRQPISVAYLLARATDTVADTAQLPFADRRRQLDALAASIQDPDTASATAEDLTASFAPLQQDTRERDLIRALPRCLAWLQELAPADRDDVRRVLGHITQGQALDVERFGQGLPLRALDSADQLDRYTYLVAGCVGEFWTDLCFRHLPGFARLPRQEMRELGRGYGMGLQLVNILRDAAADLAAGRCYFPAEELAATGLQPHEITLRPDRLAGVWSRWQAQAQHGLELGMRYAEAVNPRRVRAASAMPALIGARTLALLRAAGPRGLQHKVKMPRREVRAMMIRLAFSLAGRAPLRAQFQRLCDSASRSGWDNAAS